MFPVVRAIRCVARCRATRLAVPGVSVPAVATRITEVGARSRRVHRHPTPLAPGVLQSAGRELVYYVSDTPW